MRSATCLVIAAVKRAQTKRVNRNQMSTKRERRKWALEIAASLLHSDMDNFTVDEFDEDEMDKRRAAVREIAKELQRKAARIQL